MRYKPFKNAVTANMTAQTIRNAVTANMTAQTIQKCCYSKYDSTNYSGMPLKQI
jgi:hypothetical protein